MFIDSLYTFNICVHPLNNTTNEQLHTHLDLIKKLSFRYLFYFNTLFEIITIGRE